MRRRGADRRWGRATEDASGVRRGRAAVCSTVGALGLLGALAPVGPLVGSASAAAVTVSVTSTVDDGSPGTLRWAVDQVNAAAPGDTVTVEVAAGTYVLSVCGAGQDDTNVAGDLDARPGGALAVTAVGGAVTIQQSCVGERVLDVLPAAGAAPGDPSAPVSLTGVTVTGGNVIGDGGGIRAAGDVSLTDVTLEGNAASALPAPDAATPGTEVRGGGVFAAGTVVVTGGAVRSNSATGGDAASPGESHGGSGTGGGIAATEVELHRAAFDSNAAAGGFGGWNAAFIAQPGGAGRGGGAFAVRATIDGATFTANTAEGAGGSGAAAGGALVGDVIAVVGASFTDNAAIGAPQRGGTCGVPAAPARGGAIDGGVVDVRTSTFQGNRANAGDGAGPTGSGCSSQPGGGAVGGAIAGQQLTVADSSTSGNRAVGGASPPLTCTSICGTRGGPAAGGALWAQQSLMATRLDADGDDAVGGLGLYPFFGIVYRAPSSGNVVYAAGTLDVDASHLHRSVAPVGSGAAAQGAGPVRVVGSTFGPGVGPALASDASVLVQESTLARDDFATGNATVDGPSVTLERTTLVGSVRMPSVGADLAADQLAATGSLLTSADSAVRCRAHAISSGLPVTVSGGANVIRDPAGTCGFGAGVADVVGDGGGIGDIGPLVDHGGGLPTVAPSSTNPAIDRVAGPCADPTDQRGVARPQGAGCDAGALEVDGAATDLRVSVAVDATGPVDPGTPVRLDVAVDDAGPADAAETLLTIELPATWTSITASDGGSCSYLGSGPVLGCRWPTALVAGTTRIVVVEVPVPGDGRPTATYAARVGHLGFETAPSDNEASVTLAVTSASDVRVSIPTVTQPLVGIERWLPVDVVTDGPNASFASVSRPLTVEIHTPAGLPIARSTSECTVSADVATCVRTTPLLPGDTWRPAVSVLPRGVVVGQLTAEVVSYLTPDPVTSNNRETSPVSSRKAVADLAVTTSTTGDLVVGSTGQMTFTVTNNGSDPAPRSLPITLQLPAGVAAQVSGLPAGCTAGSGPGAVVSCSKLAGADGTAFDSGALVTLTIPLVVVGGGPSPAAFVAAVGAPVWSDGTAIPFTDPTPGNNPLVVNRIIRPLTAELAVTDMTFTPGCNCLGTTVFAGRTANTTIRIANHGPDTVSGVAVDVTAPAGTTFGPSDARCVPVAGGLRCVRTTSLASGGTDQFGVSFTPGPGSPDPYVVQAHVSSAYADGISTNDDRELRLGFVGDPTADASPTIRYVPPQGASTATLTFEAHNAGPGLSPAEPLVVRLSTGFGSVAIAGQSWVGCTKPVHLPDTRWEITCTPTTPFSSFATPPTLVLSVVRSVGPVRAEVTMAASNDPNPENNSAVWVPGGPGAASIVGVATRQGSTDVLGGITVSLLSAYPGWSVVKTTTTDANGSYRFDGVAPGSYQLRFFDPSGAYGRQWWSSDGTYRVSQPVVVAAGATTTANQELAAAPTGSLHGRALGSWLTPLAGIRVRVFSVADGYVGGAVTGADGYYQLNGLPAGDYFVQFVDPTHTLLSRWFGGAVTFANADVVTVGADAVWASVVLR